MGFTAQAAEPTIGPNYLRLTPVSFSVIGGNNQVNREVSIVLILELKPGVTEADIQPFQPKLQDAILVGLTDLWESAPTSDVRTSQIKQKLLPMVDAIVGNDKVAQILVVGLGENLS